MNFGPALFAVSAILLLLGPTSCSARRELARPEPGVIDVPDTLALPRTPVPVREATAPLEVAEGEATYYALHFEGRPTASGLVFSNAECYAAHRTYPFGTLLRVTSLENLRSVIVTVVDRGPHGSTARARATIIDLSQRAATDLDFIRAGRIRVRVEVLHWGSELQ